jgi:XTP/dITP diphosphohydrolase
MAEMPEPVEDAPTFMANAELKAVAYSRLALAAGRAGLLVFADDSGLEVQALDGEPGVRSARFAEDAGYGAGTGAKKDERNNGLLLDRLTWTSAWASRAARFVCALALARDGEVLLRAEGEVDGEILRKPRGTDGFGYDPLFLVPPLGLTMAELGPEQKWEVSHRGRAFRELLGKVRECEL